MGLIKKLSLWFFIVILGAFGLTYFVVAVILNANNEAVISSAMPGFRDSCEAYIKRYIIDSGATDDLIYNIQGFTDEFADILGCGVALYDPQGNYYEGTYDDSGYVKDDVTYACSGMSAYSVVKGWHNTYATFSFPVLVNNQVKVIVRLRVDYTENYNNSNNILEMTLLSCLGILCVAVILLVIYIAWVIKPVNKLSNAITKVSENPYEAMPLDVKSKDEIGRLTENYNHMAMTIRDQWNTIQLEKENLKKTIQYKKDFYDNITHELKTPLTIILGYAEMIQQTNFEDEEFNRKGMDQVITESKRLCAMVAGLLEASRATGNIETKFEATSLDKLLENIVSSMKVKASRYAVPLQQEIERGLNVLGKPEELRKLFVNLIDNAIKYSVTGKPISIAAKAADGTIDVTVENQVEENGVDPKDFDKIFMPFYRSRDVAKKEAGSVGLGLAICRNIVDDHGGSITVTMSEKNRICFCVELPSMLGSGEEDIAHEKPAKKKSK